MHAHFAGGALNENLDATLGVEVLLGVVLFMVLSLELDWRCLGKRDRLAIIRVISVQVRVRLLAHAPALIIVEG